MSHIPAQWKSQFPSTCPANCPFQFPSKSLIVEFETDVSRILSFYEEVDVDLAVERVLLPLDIKGFGHVKEQSANRAAERRRVIMDKFNFSEIKLRAAE